MVDKDKKFRFSGHQTFVFRYGWLEKGVRGIAEHLICFSGMMHLCPSVLERTW